MSASGTVERVLTVTLLTLRLVSKKARPVGGSP